MQSYSKMFLENSICLKNTFTMLELEGCNYDFRLTPLLYSQSGYDSTHY